VAGAHDETVRREFERQAATFTATGWASSGLDWIVGQVRPAADEQVLDVAAGAGHLGRALAPHVAHVTALDLTPAVLKRGKADADAAGQRNVLFEVGDAAHLLYLDESFDVVVSRLAVHHFADPTVQAAEMVRVCRPTGRIVVVDMIVSADAAASRDRLERLRDPSHVRTPTLEALRNLLDDAGASVITWQTRENALRMDDWLDRTQAPSSARQEIEAALRAEVAGRTITGMRPHLRGSELWFTHVWAAVTATPRA